jgi:hypothetical protein
MADRKLDHNAVQCARRFDGHVYQRLHREYSFIAAFNTFKKTHHWNHLSIVEAMATMALLEQALQAWAQSKNVEPEALKDHYEAFHSLYLMLKDIDPARNP